MSWHEYGKTQGIAAAKIRDLYFSEFGHRSKLTTEAILKIVEDSPAGKFGLSKILTIMKESPQ